MLACYNRRMTSPDRLDTVAYPSDEQLQRLHVMTRSWLGENGSQYIVETFGVATVVLSATVSFDRIQAAYPEAADVLGLQDDLRLECIVPGTQPGLSNGCCGVFRADRSTYSYDLPLGCQDSSATGGNVLSRETVTVGPTHNGMFGIKETAGVSARVSQDDPIRIPRPIDYVNGMIENGWVLVEPEPADFDDHWADSDHDTVLPFRRFIKRLVWTVTHEPAVSVDAGPDDDFEREWAQWRRIESDGVMLSPHEADALQAIVGGLSRRRTVLSVLRTFSR